MARLLHANAAAKRAGIGYHRFRAICAAGNGPAAFNPPYIGADGEVFYDGRVMYVDTVVDAWLEARDDRPERKAS